MKAVRRRRFVEPIKTPAPAGTTRIVVLGADHAAKGASQG